MSTFLRNFFFILGLLGWAQARATTESVVFQQGEAGYQCFRIPAIVKAPDGTLLAFAEARRNNCSDHGDVRIVLKTSLDNGKTWGDLRVVADNGQLQAGNPAPVFDELDKRFPQGRLFLLYNTGTGSEAEVRAGKAMREVWYKTSVDQGKTWSNPVNITRFVSRPNHPQTHPSYRFPADWRHYANTPGHALQLKEGRYRGRLYIAANHSEGPAQDQGRDYLAHGFYSDDHGKTWRLSANVTYRGSNESSAAELANGGLLLNCRNQSGDTKHRIMARSQNGGQSWDSIYVEHQLPDPVCEGSMLNYTTKNGQKWLLFSNLESQSRRENLILYASGDEGISWHKAQTIYPGPAAYSDLVVQQDGAIGVLYEKDGYTKIVYAVVYPEQLFNLYYPLSADRWKGFERQHFLVDNVKAYLVKPRKALPGNPWVWRASFPDWHTAMDSLLLEKGVHLVFVQVDDQYGSPAAMQAWQQVYQHLVEQWGFSSKPALEAVSRGGLYAYAWAKRHPDKLSCIYAEAPVCAIQSWPGGKGKGPGDAKSWAQLLEVYGLSAEAALAYNDNPVDHLEGLAAHKVPILHVISNADRIVPADENTYLLVQRYTALGGPASVYPVTDGPQVLDGHHFPINRAAEWADFILRQVYPVQPPLSIRLFEQRRNGLSAFQQTIATQKQVTVAFLGGSITYNRGWRDKTCAYLREKFPLTEFRFINAGIPSLGSLPHAFRLSQDVLEQGKIDLLFLESAVNDRANGTDSLTQIQALEGIIRHAKRSNPKLDIILMAFADPDKNQDYSRGRVPVEVQNHERIAAHYGLPSINLAQAVYEKVKLHEFSWTDDFKDLHPSPFGQECYASAIKTLLEDCFQTLPLPAVPLPPALHPASLTQGKYLDLQAAKNRQGWQLEPNWTPKDGLPTRPGFVHCPMLTSTEQGSQFLLDFSGTAIGIAIVSGPDAGIIEYSVDGQAYRKLDLFTPWSTQLHLPWYLLLDAGLKPGKHQLSLRMSRDKNPLSSGHAARIVHFLLNE